MSRAHLTALVAALAVGAVAPRLAAQDTSAARPSAPDTSAYTGAGGVDTSAAPMRVEATDTIRLGGAADTSGASDTSGMSGRHPADPTLPGDTTAAASGGVSKPDSASAGEPGDSAR